MTKTLSSLFIGIFILCFVGLNNKFPLLVNGSGGYIDSGFLRSGPFNFNLLYGFFVAHSSWGKSLWLVIVTQSTLLSIVLFFFFRTFIKETKSRLFYYLAYVGLITFLMSGSKAASTVSPVIFGNISALAIGIILFNKKLIFRDQVLLIIISVVSISMDISYLFNSLAIFLLFSLKVAFGKTAEGNKVWLYGIKRLGIVTFLSLMLLATAYLNFSNFVSKKYLPVYLLPRLESVSLATSKVPDTSLIDHKGERNCQVLSRRYIDGGRFIKGSFSKSELECFEQMGKELLSRQDIFKNFLGAVLRDFSTSIWNVKIEKNRAAQNNKETLLAIQSWFRDDVREFYLAKQQMGSLNFGILNFVQIMVAVISVMFYVYVLLSEYQRAPLFKYFIAVYLINLISFAVFYGVGNDLQKEIIWILPLPIFIYLSDLSASKSNLK